MSAIGQPPRWLEWRIMGLGTKEQGLQRVDSEMAAFGRMAEKAGRSFSGQVRGLERRPRVASGPSVCGCPSGCKGVAEILARGFRCFRVSILLMQPSSRLLA